MPYQLTKDKKGVEKSDTGEVLKRYSGPGAKQKARAYLYALNKNVEDAGGGGDKSDTDEKMHH